MKNIYLLSFIIMGLLVGCQQDESSGDTERQDLALNWEKANPEEVFGDSENGFSITRDALKHALKLPNVSTVRFILEVENKQLQIRVAGANPNGDVTSGVVAQSISVKKTVNKLYGEKSTRFVTETLSKSVSVHAMQPDQAITFVSGWQQKWDSKSLEEAIAYNGQRIRHFSMPAEVARHMLQSDSKRMNLVWGVNPKGKFTTVFIPELDEKSSLLQSRSLIYEYSSPCPPTCIQM